MIKLLIKNRLLSLVSSVFSRKRKGGVEKPSIGKIVGFSILYLYVIGVFCVFSAMMAISVGSVMIPMGASWLYFAIFMLASLTVLFILSIFETKTELFDCKDNDLLLSMPIKPRDIVASRISVVMLYNYAEEAVIMLPCIIVYAVFSRDVIGVFGAILVSLFIPLIATTLASGVGFIVAYIAKRTSKNTFVTVAISVVFLILYFWGYDYLMNSMEAALNAFDGIEPEELPLLYAIGSAALLNPISLPAFAVLSIALAAVAYYLILRNYIKLATDNRGAKHAVYKGEIIKARSSFAALICKELRRFFTSSVYILNCGIGIVMQVVLAVVALVNASTIKEVVIGLFADGAEVNYGEIAAPVMIMAIVLISTTCMISACSLSLEGNNLWILKTMPVNSSELLLAKALAQVIITTPTTVISSVIMIIASSADVKFWPLFILLPLAANVFFSLFGIIINVAFPKFDFENEAQPIKQSLSSFVVMMSQMIIGMALTIVSAVSVIFNFGFLYTVLVFAAFVALSIGAYFMLVGPCKRRYESFEA
jgi:ABC-2 type transport system permease protein